MLTREELGHNADVVISTLIGNLRTIELVRSWIVYDRNCPDEDLQIRIATAFDPFHTNTCIQLEAMNALLPQGCPRLTLDVLERSRLDLPAIARMSGRSSAELLGAHPK